MNEGNRGQKGGLNDRRRVIKLRKKEIERLKELNEEESLKKVLKENEIKELLNIIPLVIIKIVIDSTKSNKVVSINRDKNEKQQEPQKPLAQEIEVEADKKPKEEGFVKVEKIEEEKKEPPIIENIILPGILLLEGTPKITKIEKIDFDDKDLVPSVEKSKEEKETKIDTIPLEETKEDKKDRESEKKQSEIDKKLERLQSNKIVEKYEEKLMGIRHDLRKLIYEYNVIVDRNNKLETKDEAERLLDSLNKLIKKIDELKKKLEIPDNDKYDETYLYAIAEEYMKEFSNNKPIKEITSSPLYISISNKVKELDKAKDRLKKTIDSNKKTLGINEDKVEKLKSKYDSIASFDKKMDAFTSQAEKELKDVEDKVKNMLPTNKSAKRAALIATVGAYVLNRILNRRRVEVRENVKVTVKDYSERIEKDLDKIEDVQKTLSKNTKDLDKIISLLENDYKDVVAANSEYKELLINLKIIKSNLQEKEYDLRRINDDTKKSLDENNHKVMKYN